MTHTFDDDAIDGVLGHMNRDHGDDNLLIARAFAVDAGITVPPRPPGAADASPGASGGVGPAEISAAQMIAFDGDQGVWQATLADGSTVEVAVPWPSGQISERREVRREIVALYDEACRRLRVEPRPHA
jgi:hypothetical protein